MFSLVGFKSIIPFADIFLSVLKDTDHNFLLFVTYQAPFTFMYLYPIPVLLDTSLIHIEV